MVVSLSINGQTFLYPEENDIEWAFDATGWARALSSGTLQFTGGNWDLSAEADFGDTYGFITPYVKSNSTPLPVSGTLRLGTEDLVTWRNSDDDGDLVLGVNSEGQLIFNGEVLDVGTTPTVSDTATIDMDISGTEISGNVQSDSLTNVQINSAAAIARSKLAAGTVNRLVYNDGSTGLFADLAAITASRALVSDSNSLPSASSVTSTELGYLSGVTSAIQTQLNTKLGLSGGTLSGNLALGSNNITGVNNLTVDNELNVTGESTVGNVTFTTGANTIAGIQNQNLVDKSSAESISATWDFDGVTINSQSIAPPVGAVIDYAGSSAPVGWLICNGDAVSRSTYSSLFSVIGTTYGSGDGSTTFNVPDARGRTSIGVGTGSGLTARALADTGGEETHELTEAEMPAHTHTVPVGGTDTFVDKLAGAQGATIGNVSSSSTGSGDPHNNMPPFLALHKIIRHA